MIKSNLKLEKKELMKINRAKLVPKLVLAILLFTLIASFTGSFVTAYGRHRRVTKYDFEAIAIQRAFVPKRDWIEDGVFHMIFYKENDLSGTINGIEFTGWTEDYLYLKVDLATGDQTVYGKADLYISWEGLSGKFSGPLYAKGGPGWMEGIYFLRGTKDFAGWFLFGRIWNIESGTNGLSGTILVPN